MPGEANLEAKVTVKIDTRAARRELDELDRKSRRSDQSQRNEQRATEDLRRERGEPRPQPRARSGARGQEGFAAGAGAGARAGVAGGRLAAGAAGAGIGGLAMGAAALKAGIAVIVAHAALEFLENAGPRIAVILDGILPAAVDKVFIAGTGHDLQGWADGISDSITNFQTKFTAIAPSVVDTFALAEARVRLGGTFPTLNEALNLGRIVYTVEQKSQELEKNLNKGIAKGITQDWKRALVKSWNK